MNKYVNRELSWLLFNDRIIDQATRDEEYTDDERLNFLTISHKNMDEFFKVRVGSLMGKYIHHRNYNDPAGYDLPSLLSDIRVKTVEMVNRQTQIAEKFISNLENHKSIHFISSDELHSRKDDIDLKKYTEDIKHLFSLVNDIYYIQNDDDLKILPSGQLIIYVELVNKKGKITTVAIPLPSMVSRLAEISDKPNEDTSYYILLETLRDVFIPEMFSSDMKIQFLSVFRLIRSADFTIKGNEHNEEYLHEIDKNIHKREYGDVVRIDVLDNFDNEKLESLVSKFSVKDKFTDDSVISVRFKPMVFKFKDTALMDISWMEEFINMPSPDEGFEYPVFSNFNSLGKTDILLRYPEDSMNNIVRMIQLAADDDDVTEIYMTIYRVSKDSPIIDALVKAARNGKKVTVAVELKARFDESRNITNVRRLEYAGATVLYNTGSLKLHAKLILITRVVDGKVHSYCNIGTGNYNEKTSKIYTDMGLISSDKQLCAEVKRVFHHIAVGNIISKITSENSIISVLPEEMIITIMDAFMEAYNGQKEDYKSGYHVRIKMNSLLDRDVINMLYKMADVGIKIDLIIRGICALIPREGIRVKSVVGRHLEHSRYFAITNNYSDPKVFISSADFMPRNLCKRIECICEIKDDDIKEEIIKDFDEKMSHETYGYYMSYDEINGHVMYSDSVEK